MKLVVFIYGLIFGSFYNVCIYRIPNKKSIAFPPSSCGNCNHKLHLIDLIPIASYVFLKGRCRYCNEKISIQYPLIELFTGLLFLFSYIQFGMSIMFIKSVVLVSIVLIVSMIDFKHYIIPDSISLLTFVLGIIFNLIIRDISIKSLIFAFILGGGFLFVIALIGPMGGGDIKIMAGFALFLGFEKTILALLLSFTLGGIIGILLIVTKIKGRKDNIPFGPFLGMGSYISFIYFEQIFNWYINLI
jgi:leader peptidase (prepilin peptidase)/N-methyltransferase